MAPMEESMILENRKLTWSNRRLKQKEMLERNVCEYNNAIIFREQVTYFWYSDYLRMTDQDESSIDGFLSVPTPHVYGNWTKVILHVHLSALLTRPRVTFISVPATTIHVARCRKNDVRIPDKERSEVTEHHLSIASLWTEVRIITVVLVFPLSPTARCPNPSVYLSRMVI